MTETGEKSRAVSEWLATSLGESLLQQESRAVEEAFDGIFGEQCLQLGHWGDPHTFLRFARTQRFALIAETECEEGRFALGQLHRLPVASDSIDLVLLPHTLDYSDRSQAILREVHRVLRSDGHLVVLGFKPGGLWGLRRLLPGAGMPPAIEHLIAERRLRDWLQLLDMRIHGIDRFFFRWPLSGNRSASSQIWEQRGQRWWPELAACYMLTAQKRISTLTPVRPTWRKTAKVVTGLAEPSTRVSRIRFEQDS
jgi:SAM-dependent methyltransferase